MIVNKKENLPSSGLSRPGWSQGKIERKRKGHKHIELVKYLKKQKQRNIEVTFIPIIISALSQHHKDKPY